MRQIQISIIVFLIITISISTIRGQNPFPQTSIYKSLDIKSINRNSSTTSNSEPGRVTNDIFFELNNNGFITREITFPDGKFERESYKTYKSDTLLIEEGSWATKRKNHLHSQRIYKYDNLSRLIEEVFYVSMKLRSTKKYQYVEDTRQLLNYTESSTRTIDTCYYNFTNSRLDSIICTSYKEFFSERNASIRQTINYKSTKFTYDKSKRLIREDEIYDNGNLKIKEYAYASANSSKKLIREETIRNNGSFKSTKFFEYDNEERLITSTENYFRLNQNDSRSIKKYYYNNLGLLTEKQTIIEEETEYKEKNTTMMNFSYDYNFK